MMTAFHYLPKNFDNGFKLEIHSIFQCIAKFRSKCMKTKMILYPELIIIRALNAFEPMFMSVDLKNLILCLPGLFKFQTMNVHMIQF